MPRRKLVHPIIVWLLVAFLATSVAWADPVAGASVNVQKTSDRVVVTVESSGRLGKPEIKMVPSPNYLEMVIKPAVLKAGKGTVAVDRGLIQKVEVKQQGADTVVVRVYVISKPKNTLDVTGDGKKVTLGLSTMEMATSPSRPATTPPTAASPPPTVAVKPPTQADKPPAEPDAAPAQPDTMPAVVPTRPVAATPTSATTSPRAAVASKPISVTYQAGDLKGALQALAEAAGLKAEIHPAVKGAVTASFTDIPLNLAVTDLLGQSETLYLYEISETTLAVYPQEQTTTRPSSPTTRPSSPTTRPSSPSPARTDAIAREYFPLKDKSATEMAEAARKAVPGLKYAVDARLNVIIAEGHPDDLQRLRAILRAVSQK